MIDLPAQSARDHLLHAEAYRQLGRMDDALGSCARALELKPDFGDVWLMRADLELRRGDRSAALESANQALADPRTHQAARIMLERLRQRGD